MAFYALILFGVAALGGLYMASKIFKGVLPPNVVPMVHGALGAIGIILLLMAYLEGRSDLLTPLIIFVIAALGGFFMVFAYHRKKQLPPKAIVIIHALAALAGVVLLFLAAT